MQHDREHSATVTSACWATVDWSWQKEWKWCVGGDLHLRNKFLKMQVRIKSSELFSQNPLTWGKSFYHYHSFHCSSGSDAHFCRSLFIDRLKSQKADCSNPHQDIGLITVLVVSCPIFFIFYDAADKPSCCCFPTRPKPEVSIKHRHVDKCILSTGAPCFGWSKRPCIVHSQMYYAS